MPSERDFGRAKPFSQAAIGETFWCNGNIWTKRTSRTATGIWPACLPSWSYFGQSEIVKVRESK
jgi:hypothetical protein